MKMRQLFSYPMMQVQMLIFFFIFHRVQVSSNYMYHIDTSSHVIEGFVYEDHEPESKILVNRDPLRKEREMDYLQIKVTDPLRNIAVEELKNTTEFRIDKADSVYIDGENYLVINSTNVFENSTEFEFFVVVVDQLSGEYLSNPLPFIIRQIQKEDTSEQSYSHEAAIFAGVLILVIVFLAFLIPCVVRAKRRMRAGKPVMKLGSHTESEVAFDRRKANENSGFSSRTSSVPNWYGESAVNNYAGEIEKEKIHFTKDIKHLEHDLEQQGRATFSVGSDEVKIVKVDQPTRGILKNSNSDHTVSRL